MADERRNLKTRPAVAGPTKLRGRPFVLVVGLSARAIQTLPRHVLAPDARVNRVNPRLLARRHVRGTTPPDLILAPLMGTAMDAVELLPVLVRARYPGRVLALAPNVPDIALIRAELSDAAPALNVDVVALDGSSALHLV